MHPDQDPSEKNRPNPKISQTAVSGVTAETISIGQIVQRVVYLGLPFNSSHRRFAQFISVIAYAACLVAGFVRLVQGDAGLVTKLLLIVGSGLLSLTCLYYAWFWQPEYQDSSPPISGLSPSDGQVKAQQVKQRQRKQIRHSAIVGVFAIPLVTFAGFFTWQNLPAKETIVLVARFYEQQSSLDDLGVTDRIIEALRIKAEGYPNVKVSPLRKAITVEDGDEVAYVEGKQRKAAIVIWGWYDQTSKVVQASTHFKILNLPNPFPKLGEEASGAIRTIPIETSQPDDPELQTNLAREMTYLSLFTIGMAQYVSREWNEAISLFTRALEEAEKVGEPISSLDQSFVHFYLGFSHHFNGEYANALVENTKAIQLNSDNGQFYAGRGAIHFTQGNYELSVEDLTQGIQKFEPSNPDGLASTHIVRGQAYYSLKDYDRAIADAKQVIDLEPAPSSTNIVLAYVLQGQVYEAQGQVYEAQIKFDHAIQAYTQALQISSDNHLMSLAYSVRGHSYKLQGDYTKSIADLTQAIRLNPENVDAYRLRGNLYNDIGLEDFGKGNIDSAEKTFISAIKDYNAVIEIDPDDAVVYGSRGSIYSLKGDSKRAIEDYTQALQKADSLDYSKVDPTGNLLSTQITSWYFLRGQLYAEQGDYDRAIEDYTQALQLKSSDDAQAYFNRGAAYLQSGDRNNAINDFKKTLELTQNPNLRQSAEQVLQQLEAQ